MTIRRAPRRKRFTVIDNGLLNDTTLSFRAIGVAVHVLSKPDHWSTDAESLARQSSAREGRDAIRTALVELEDAGYLVRYRVPTGGGRWASMSVLFETRDEAAEYELPEGAIEQRKRGETSGRLRTVPASPEPENPSPAPEPGKPASGGPASGRPVSGQPVAKGERTERCNTESNHPPFPPQGDGRLFGGEEATPAPEQKPAKGKGAPKWTAAERDALADALADVCRINLAELTKPSARTFGVQVAWLLDVAATPDEVRRRAAAWRALYQTATLTPAALVKHWASLGNVKPITAARTAPVREDRNVSAMRAAFPDVTFRR